MSGNWVVGESKKAGGGEDVLILEKPDVKKNLDGLLLEKFWPVILDCLVDTGYVYSPEENPETDFELSRLLERSLSFMLFENRVLFFRGKIAVSAEAWMLESEFYLGLPKEVQPGVVFEILGNSRFIGMPPVLSIYKKDFDFYQIKFQHGSGASWGLYGGEYAEDRIRDVIDINVKMHEFSKDGVISPQNLGEFLSLAYEVYEAY